MKIRCGPEFLLQFSLDFALQLHVVVSGQDKDTSEHKKYNKHASYTYTRNTNVITPISASPHFFLVLRVVRYNTTSRLHGVVCQGNDWN